MLEVSPTKQIGLGIAAFGLLFMTLGVVLFFDSALLALGNVLLVAGSICVLGVRRCTDIYLAWGRRRASAVIFTGLVFVLSGWARIGLIVELTGFFMLFRAALPSVPSLASLPLFAATVFSSDTSGYSMFDSAPQPPPATSRKQEAAWSPFTAERSSSVPNRFASLTENLPSKFSAFAGRLLRSNEAYSGRLEMRA